MSETYVFGFGSLVNANTHDYTEVHLASLAGWRRIWQHTTLRPFAFLSVERAPNSAIAGTIAHVPGQSWAALDAREFAYDRVPITSEVQHAKPIETPIDIALYAVPDDSKAAPATRHPVLLSYIDVVVQGYLHGFGEAGVAAFFDSTAGWDLPVRNDRATPQYPRHQNLSRAETALVDHYLAKTDARIVDDL